MADEVLWEILENLASFGLPLESLSSTPVDSTIFGKTCMNEPDSSPSPLSFVYSDSPLTTQGTQKYSPGFGDDDLTNGSVAEDKDYNSNFPMPANTRERIHLFFTDPKSGKGAKHFSLYLDALVIVSLIAFCFESVPQFSTSLLQRSLWFGLESFISINFLLDFLVKLITQKTWRSYSLTWGALIDFLSILPWGFEFIFQSPLHIALASKNIFSSLRLLRLLRFVRFFKLTIGNFPRIGLFITAVRRSGLAVLFLVIYIFGVGLFFSGCLYYAETSICSLDRDEAIWVLTTDPKQLCGMQNMFDAIWLCLVTMATVGYGDTVPTTSLGKVIAAIIMITSMVFLPLPVSIFGANLTELYLEERLARKLDKRRHAHPPHAHPEVTEHLHDTHSLLRKDKDPNHHHYQHPMTSEITSHSAPVSATDPLWPNPHPVQVMTMRDTVNLFAMMEALEVTTDEIATELSRANHRLNFIRNRQRHVEALVIEQQVAAHGPQPDPPQEEISPSDLV